MMQFLSKIGDLLTQAQPIIGQLAQLEQQNRQQDFFDKVFAANPAYAQQYFGALDAQAQTEMGRQRLGLDQQVVGLRADEANRERERMEALRNLARTPGFNPQADMGGALARYAEISGDLSPLFEYQQNQQITPFQQAQLDIDRQRIAQANASMGMSPAAVREYQYFNSLSPEEQREYLSVKRAVPIVNTGDAQTFIDPLTGAPMSSVPINVSPDQDPMLKREQEKQKLLGQAEGEKIAGMGAATRAFEAARQKNEFVNSKARDVLARVNAGTAGFIGSLSSAVPGTPAYDLKSDIDTIVANAGFDLLQEMRDNSPTGGALGQVTERELALLQSAAGNLVNSQSPAQLRRNLEEFIAQRELASQRIEDAYQRDLQRFGQSAMPAAATGATRIRFDAQGNIVQ